jgi:hypothetical protein
MRIRREARRKWGKRGACLSVGGFFECVGQRLWAALFRCLSGGKTEFELRRAVRVLRAQRYLRVQLHCTLRRAHTTHACEYEDGGRGKGKEEGGRGPQTVVAQKHSQIVLTPDAMPLCNAHHST